MAGGPGLRSRLVLRRRTRALPAGDHAGLCRRHGGQRRLYQVRPQAVPLAGAARAEGSGKLLDYRAEVPRELKFYMCFFPDRERFADAGYRVGEAEVGYVVSKSAMPAYFLCLLPHLLGKIRVKPALRAVIRDSLKYLLMVVLAADTPREMRYQESAVKEILSRCGGIGLELFQSTPSLGSMFWMNFIRVTIIPLIYRVGGQFSTGWPKDETWDVLVEYADRAEATKREWIAKGGILDDMGDCAWTTLYENTHYAHCEEIFTYDPRNPRHLEAIDPLSMDFAITAIEQCMEQGFNIDPRMRKLFDPLLGHYNYWQKKISRDLDPAGAADAGFYTGEENFDLSSIEEDKKEKLLRLMAERAWADPLPPG